MKGALSTLSANSARVLTLQGQLIQEVVLAEELQKAEDQQERCLRRLEAEVLAEVQVRRCSLGRESPSTTSRSQHPLQLRLARMELDAQALQEGAANAEVLEYLHAEEQRLSDETRSKRNSEQAAFEEVEKQRSEMLSLKAECSAASVSVEHPPNEVVEHELRNSLPPGHPALRLKRFDDLLAALELEKEEILEELREDSGLWQAQREVEELSGQLLLLEEATRRRTQQSQAVQRRIQQAGPAVAEVDDLHAQAAALEKENEILSRQQVEWHRSQNLMLRLAEEKVPPNRPESGVLRGMGVLSANEAFRQRVRQLQEEKAELVRSQKGPVPRGEGLRTAGTGLGSIMEDSLYDEFGNYQGPDIDDDEDEEDDDLLGGLDEEEKGKGDDDGTGVGDVPMEGVEASGDRQIILHEDKKYYPDAEEVYGDAEALVQMEDTQPLTDPIITPVQSKNFDLLEKKMPDTTFDFNFLAAMMDKPNLVRNICFLGAMHHGKTTFMDLLVLNTHEKDWKVGKEIRYTDSRQDEQDRGITVKASSMSLVLQDSKDKSYLFHAMDTPGHSNFQDEVIAALALADGVVLVVDVVVGLTQHIERMLKHAFQDNLKVVLVINGLDRLIMELKLPPTDAYHKLRYCIEDINETMEKLYDSAGTEVDERVYFSPLKGNVIFSSALFRMVFTLESYAAIYAETHGFSFDHLILAKCLWGDMYYNAEERKFQKTPPDAEQPRSFVQFVLEPIYKIFAHCLGEEKEDLAQTLAEVGIYLHKRDYELDARALIRKVFQQYFGSGGGLPSFVDMVVRHIPNPKENAAIKVEKLYSGDQDGAVSEDMKKLDTTGYLMLHVVKQYHRPDCNAFDVFGRVLSGTVFRGDRVKILGETYSLDDDEDMAIKEIQNLWILEGRYRVEVSHVPAGNWVLIGGIETCIKKTATITTASNEEEVEIFRPLRFPTTPVIKVAIEPLQPAELPKMVDGLRKIDKAYPLSKTKVEESGEHVLLGTGEVYLDCILHDLRRLYGDLEIKVADPVVEFCETVVETSSLKCFAETPNKKNKIYMVAEPLEKGLGEDIEKGKVSIEWNKRRMSDFFTKNYDWDLLASRSVWAFGPEVNGPNVLVDDCLPSEVNKSLLVQSKDSLVQGFQWATKEGPLCDEKIRSCKFKILNAQMAEDAVLRGGGQIIPTARRVAYSAFLLATPRLMEPVMFSDIECPADCVAAIYNVLSRRRGHVIRDLPKPGSPMYSVHAYLPAMESFGFETDLRTHTSGQAMCQTFFDHWEHVPGDPLDRSILLRPLEPAPAPHLAREFMLKMRRRKGLSEDVSVHKFFDDPMLLELAKQDAELSSYF
ncbi:116 kDa U5 small nuclear ribonucleoprotein component [Symbiodinium microadriaticum]|uniref:116 kDa U5 small nuclear ribonucleoprotein component n=1 Tax=Symbiodinium microadriaticum TaxID=2951 RepID=A0A1Q9C7H6_SYMMI|nr:116 kDa U5 small nuclear ribonucleoprotein component [Symbiodinium microadriaticum]